jgi:hypothetical protein
MGCVKRKSPSDLSHISMFLCFLHGKCRIRCLGISPIKIAAVASNAIGRQFGLAVEFEESFR